MHTRDTPVTQTSMGEGENMPNETNGQSQAQNQEQVVTINVQSSGDPTLEQRILREKYGVGRQLGTLAAVVEVLLAAHEGASLPADAERAITKFRNTQADIAREKRLRAPERLLERLSRLGQASDAEARTLCGAVRAWVDEFEAELPVAPAETGAAPVPIN